MTETRPSRHAANNIPVFGADGFPRNCVNHGRIAAFAVARKDPLGFGVVNNGGGVLARDRDYRAGSQCLQVEYCYRVRLAVARETLAEVICKRHPVDPLHVLEIGNELACTLVNNHHVIASREVNAMRVVIHPEVVPSAVTPDWNPSHYLVATSICCGKG